MKKFVLLILLIGSISAKAQKLYYSYATEFVNSVNLYKSPSSDFSGYLSPNENSISFITMELGVRMNALEINDKNALSVSMYPSASLILTDVFSSYVGTGLLVKVPVLLEYNFGFASTRRYLGKNGFALGAGLSLYRDGMFTQMDMAYAMVPTFSLTYRKWQTRRGPFELGLSVLTGQIAFKREQENVIDAQYNITETYYSYIPSDVLSIDFTIRKYINL